MEKVWVKLVMGGMLGICHKLIMLIYKYNGSFKITSLLLKRSVVKLTALIDKPFFKGRKRLRMIG